MRPNCLTRTVLILSLLASCFALASIEPPPRTYPTTQATPGPVRVTITGIEGVVQYRESDDRPWQKAQVGMTLKASAEFRVGIRSAVRFATPDFKTYTFDRLGVRSVRRMIEEEKRLNDGLEIRNGRTRYDIEAPGIEHTGTIRSPSATLSIRSGPPPSDWRDTLPFPVQVKPFTGRAVFRPRGAMTQPATQPAE
jgi:hypothetical protein